MTDAWYRLVQRIKVRARKTLFTRTELELRAKEATSVHPWGPTEEQLRGERVVHSVPADPPRLESGPNVRLGARLGGWNTCMSSPPTLLALKYRPGDQLQGVLEH